MTNQTLVEMVASASGIIEEIKDIGMRLEIGNDFSRYRAYRKSQRERPAMYPMFDVACSYIDDTNGLWICGFDKDGHIIHTQAARILDLTGRSLLKHLKLHRHKYITPMTAVDPDQTFYRGPGGLEAITGKVCYNGDFWMMPRGLGGHKSHLAITLLSRLLLTLVIKRWAPDYSFAFIAKRLAEKRLHTRYGYTNCEQGAWIGPEQEITDEEYLAWMTYKDIVELLSRQSPTVSDIKLRAA